ncbi:MAG: serine hydrolase domain-containing protein [Bacillota bacterium]|nr:serine hydrolase domain-containing protein [Bacillota bacterium]
MKKGVLYMITLVFSLTILLTGCTGKETKTLQENTTATNKNIQSTGEEAKTLQETATAANKDIRSKLIKYMDDYSNEKGFSGTVLIVKDDDILLNRGYGMADYDKKIANTPRTVFEIGSLTKQFTAAAILMLQEKKLLSVQDSINKYIPGYPNGDKIKIYNLVTQTSGIPDFFNPNNFDSMLSRKHTYTPEEIIKMFKNKSLNFEPGTKFEYSNSNYILLGYIIEKVSNMKYEDYVQKNILKPLKMNQTGFLSKKPKIENKAIGYSLLNIQSNDYSRSFEAEGSLTYAAGEMYSTAEDLYKWENALFTGKVINKQSLNEMLTPNLDSYGYGLDIDNSAEGDKVAYHGGDTLGFSSFMAKDIDKNCVLIILSNKQYDKSRYDISAGVYKILANK